MTGDDETIEKSKNSHISAINSKSQHKTIDRVKKTRIDSVAINKTFQGSSSIGAQPKQKRVKVIDNHVELDSDDELQLSDDELQTNEVNDDHSAKNEVKGAFP